jgi:thiamine biosynthesis protein ThiS
MVIRITLNGEAYPTQASTVADLVRELGYAGQAVAVERNEAIVPKNQHATTELTDGDTLELVTLVGGG